MSYDPATARAYADRRTLAELQAIQDACLEVHANGGEVSVSSGSGSISINLNNCERILANVGEAIRIKAAESADTDPELNGSPFSSGVNYSNRLIQ